MKLVRFENVMRITRYINVDQIISMKADGDDVTEMKMVNGDVYRVKGSLAACVKLIREGVTNE